MEYSSALDFLRNVGKKLHLQILTLSQGQLDAPRIDFGLRDFLSMQDRYDALLRDKIFRAHPNTIYRMTDEFLCSYLYLLLPGEPRPTVLIAGPYIPFEIRHDESLKEAQRRGVPPWLNSRMEKFFLNLPVIQDATNLLNIITAFGETIWGSSDNFQIVDVDYDERKVETWLDWVHAAQHEKEFPKNESRLCNWCCYKRYCESDGKEDWMILGK